jgi:hypothetical protein
MLTTKEKRPTISRMKKYFNICAQIQRCPVNHIASFMTQSIQKNNPEEIMNSFYTLVAQSEKEKEPLLCCGYILPEKVDLSNRHFELVLFSDAKFIESIDFTGATFNANANFTGATFNANANFTGATFNANANFTGATFNANANFTMLIVLSFSKKI